MNDRSHPDDVELTAHERLALLRIEAELRRDRRLTRRMSASPPRVWLPLTVAVLMCASIVLGVLGIRTSNPALIWGFAVIWPATLLGAFRLLCRMTGGGDRATPWV
ncbi:DUF3040 domain-containing protein [Streptomyces sp. NPDC001544]|uniref:DUF3040 domain-containing protein n=1 Tax=Streptomyces sp. NPDC001544 TaxID=3364584 RepID=UPI00367FC088